MCQSVPGWLEGTLHHTKEGDATVFFNVGMHITQERHDRMLLFGVFRFIDSESKDRSGMCLLLLTHILL